MGAMKAFAMDISYEMGYDGEINDHVMKTMACLGQYIKEPIDLFDAIADLFCDVYTSDQVDAICREAVKAHNLERLVRDIYDLEDECLRDGSATLNRSWWSRVRKWFANQFLPPIRLEGDGCGLALTGLPLESDHVQTTQLAWESAGHWAARESAGVN